MPKSLKYILDLVDLVDRFNESLTSEEPHANVVAQYSGEVFVTAGEGDEPWVELGNGLATATRHDNGKLDWEFYSAKEGDTLRRFRVFYGDYMTVAAFKKIAAERAAVKKAVLPAASEGVKDAPTKD